MPAPTLPAGTELRLAAAAHDEGVSLETALAAAAWWFADSGPEGRAEILKSYHEDTKGE